jgi:hypothetical protein
MFLLKRHFFLLISLFIFLTSSCIKLEPRVKVAISKPDFSHCYKNKKTEEPAEEKPFYKIEHCGLFYLNFSGTEYLILAPDAMAPWKPIVDTIKQVLNDRLGIPKDNVIFHANHNHQSYLFDPAPFCSTLILAVERLRAAAVPAEIAYVRASAKNLIFNKMIFLSEELGYLDLGMPFRGFAAVEKGIFDATEQVKDYFLGTKLDRSYNYKGIIKGRDIKSPAIHAWIKDIEKSNKRFLATGPIDDNLELLALRDWKTRKPIGGIVRFSAHRNYCPQFFTREVSKFLEGAPVVFMIGGGAGDGDLFRKTDGSIDSQEKRLAEADRIGTAMAQRLQASMTAAKYEPLRKIFWKRKIVDLEVAEDIRKYRGRLKEMDSLWNVEYDRARVSACTPAEFKKAREMAGRGWAIARRGDEYPDTLRSPIVLVKFNSLPMICMPGEVLTRTNQTIRDRVKAPVLVTIQLCEDGDLAYVPHPDDYQYGGYEVLNSRLSPMGVQHMIDEVVAFITSNR